MLKQILKSPAETMGKTAIVITYTVDQKGPRVLSKNRRPQKPSESPLKTGLDAHITDATNAARQKAAEIDKKADGGSKCAATANSR